MCRRVKGVNDICKLDQESENDFSELPSYPNDMINYSIGDIIMTTMLKVSQHTRTF